MIYTFEHPGQHAPLFLIDLGRNHMCWSWRVAIVLVRHTSSVERFSENPRIKLWHTSSFLLELTDFENVIFEKNHWAPTEDAEVTKVKRPQNTNENFLMKTYEN